MGVDKESGLVHTVKVTAANEHDVTMTSELLTGDEEEVYGDSGYLGAEKRPEALKKNKAGKSVPYKINRRPSPKVRITPHAPKHKSNAVSMRNPLYAPKLNMFLLWLSCSFAFERCDTEGCKSKSQK